MLPGFHAVQNAPLPVLREAAEALQLLPELLLPLRRKIAELGIVLQRLLLLSRRHVFVLPQPFTGMMSRRTDALLLPCGAIAATSLGERWRRSSQDQCQTDHRHPHRYETAPQHFALASNHITNLRNSLLL